MTKCEEYIDDARFGNKDSNIESKEDFAGGNADAVVEATAIPTSEEHYPVMEPAEGKTQNRNKANDEIA